MNPEIYAHLHAGEYGGTRASLASGVLTDTARAPFPFDLETRIESSRRGATQ